MITLGSMNPLIRGGSTMKGMSQKEHDKMLKKKGDYKKMPPKSMPKKKMMKKAGRGK